MRTQVSAEAASTTLLLRLSHCSRSELIVNRAKITQEAMAASASVIFLNMKCVIAGPDVDMANRLSQLSNLPILKSRKNVLWRKKTKPFQDFPMMPGSSSVNQTATFVSNLLTCNHAFEIRATI